VAAWDIKRLFWITEDDGDEESDSVAQQLPATASQAADLSASALTDVLACLREVDGVVGSIAMTPGGQVLGWDLPRLFDASTVSGVAHRLAQLRASLIADGSGFAGGTLTYDDYRVHIGSVPAGLVAVLAEERCNSPAVAMAIKVIGRRITGAPDAR